MRYVVLGTSELTISCTLGLLDDGAEVAALVSMPERSRPLNAADVRGFAASRSIDYHEIEDLNRPDNVRAVARYAPDHVLSCWPKLLRSQFLAIPRGSCVGTHPTDLPRSRGRHPLHWMIALGITETKLTFFELTESIDAGHIIVQVPFKVPRTIAEALQGMHEAGRIGARRVSERLRDPTFRPTPQDERSASWWRKRTAHDVTLDPRMPADLILRLVGSFAPPYPGAILIWQQHVLRVAEAAVAPSAIAHDLLRAMEPGRIIEITSRTIRLKADDAIVELTMADRVPPEMLRARIVHPPTFYMARWPDLRSHIG